MARRQLVQSNVDIGLLSQAGTTPNIVGEAIAGIGAALGEAYTKAMEKKDTIEEEKKIFEKVLEGEFEIPTFDTGDDEIVDVNDVEVLDEDDVDLFPDQKLDGSFPEKQKVKVDLAPEDKSGGGNLDSYTNVFKKLSAKEQAAWAKRGEATGMTGAENYVAYMENELPAKNKAAKESVRSFAASQPTGFIYDPTNTGHVSMFKQSQFYDKSLPYNFRNTPTPRKSPLERAKRSQRSLANVTGGSLASTSSLVGVTGVASDAISRGEQSQFTPGRTFVQKERRLSAPSWMGIGAAAVEGYNLGVERRNYKKQVQADLQDYYSEQYAGLDVEETGIDWLDKSVQAVVMQKKQQLAKHMQGRDQAFSEGRGAMYTAQHNELKKTPALLNQYIKTAQKYQQDIAEGFRTDAYDLSAMSDEQVDEALSFAKGKAPMGIADVEGKGLSVIGTTNAGMPYLKSVNSWLATGGPKLIKKQNAFDYLSGVVENFRKNQGKYQKTVIDPNTGRKVTKPMGMRELTPYLNRMFDAELDTADVVRAYASKSNWDEDGMTPEMFDAAVKNPNIADPKEFVKAKFLEVAEQMLSPYLGQYEEEEGKAALEEQKQRNRLEMISAKERVNKRKEQRKEQREKQKPGKGTAADYKRSAEYLLTGGQESSTETITQKSTIEEGLFGDSKTTEDPQTTGEQAFTYYPNLDNLQGKGISSVEQADGVLTIYGKQTVKQKDGEETATTNILESIDLTQPYEKLLQDLSNLSREYDIRYETPDNDPLGII